MSIIADCVSKDLS
jgi:hypothetical protein